MRESGLRFDAKGQLRCLATKEQIAAGRLRAISFGNAWVEMTRCLNPKENWSRMGSETSCNGAGINVAGIKAVILDYGEVLCHRPSPQEFDRLGENVRRG